MARIVSSFQNRGRDVLTAQANTQGEAGQAASNDRDRFSIGHAIQYFFCATKRWLNSPERRSVRVHSAESGQS